jgi:hypothetical protein
LPEFCFLALLIVLDVIHTFVGVNLQVVPHCCVFRKNPTRLPIR